MKKLYQNIEDVNIRGDISQLSDMVSSLDITLQKIADGTDKLTELLYRYSSGNSGKQYENALQVSLILRNTLFDASVAVNDMQNQVVAYENKLYRYEGLSMYARNPNPYLVEKRTLQLDNTNLMLKRSEMILVAQALNTYGETVYGETKFILKIKNEIGNIWLDSQYRDFSDFIDSVTKLIYDALISFNEYVVYLDERIKELD